MGSKIYYRAECCQKYAFCQKFLQIKVDKDLIWYNKVASNITIFEILCCTETGNLLSPLAPLLGEIDICIHWPFCTKLNPEQLLFEAVFDKMRISDSVKC